MTNQYSLRTKNNSIDKLLTKKMDSIRLKNSKSSLSNKENKFKSIKKRSLQGNITKSEEPSCCPIFLIAAITCSTFVAKEIDNNDEYSKSRIEKIKDALKASLETFKKEFDPFNLQILLNDCKFVPFNGGGGGGGNNSSSPVKEEHKKLSVKKAVISWNAFKERQKATVVVPNATTTKSDCQPLVQIDFKMLDEILGKNEVGKILSKVQILHVKHTRKIENSEANVTKPPPVNDTAPTSWPVKPTNIWPVNLRNYWPVNPRNYWEQYTQYYPQDGTTYSLNSNNNNKFRYNKRFAFNKNQTQNKSNLTYLGNN
jgi:hypothetical protein